LLFHSLTIWQLIVTIEIDNNIVCCYHFSESFRGWSTTLLQWSRSSRMFYHKSRCLVVHMCKINIKCKINIVHVISIDPIFIKSMLIFAWSVCYFAGWFLV
jgi:hypothetical protein